MIKCFYLAKRGLVGFFFVFRFSIIGQSQRETVTYKINIHIFLIKKECNMLQGGLTERFYRFLP